MGRERTGFGGRSIEMLRESRDRDRLGTTLGHAWCPSGPADWFLPLSVGPVACGCYGNEVPVRRHVTLGVGQPFLGTPRRDSKPGLPPHRKCLGGKGWPPRRRSVLGTAPERQLPQGLTGRGMGISVQPLLELPKPCCHVCRTLGRQPEFPNLLEKQGWKAGHVSQTNCSPVNRWSFTPRLRNCPKWNPL